MPSRVVHHSYSECVLNFYGDLKWQKKMRRGISILLFVVSFLLWKSLWEHRGTACRLLKTDLHAAVGLGNQLTEWRISPVITLYIMTQKGYN